MQPLRGVRVVDLSRVLAGPYCTMVLADLGADVIKVERPEGGDETRSWGPPFAGGEAAYYLSVNRGKRSCALDLSQPEGRELALELCAGGRRGDRELQGRRGRPARGRLRAGAGAQPARRVLLDHRLRLASASRPGRPGYDFVAQAESGLMSITGAEDGPPYKVGVALVDVLAGLHAAAAILAGLHGGEGARIEVPLLDSGAGRARERGAERARHRRRAGAATATRTRTSSPTRTSRPPRAGSRSRPPTTGCSGRSAARSGSTSWPATSASRPTPRASSTATS